MAGEKYAARRVYWADMVHQCNQSGMIKIDWLRQCIVRKNGTAVPD